MKSPGRLLSSISIFLTSVMLGCGPAEKPEEKAEAPLFHAQARLLISEFDGETPAAIPLVENERLLLTSRPVLEAFIAKRKKIETGEPEVEVLPNEVSAVARRLAVEHLEGAGILEIRATALHPANAAMMANGLIEAYLANRALLLSQNKAESIGALETEIAQAQDKLAKAQALLAQLEQAHPDAAPADPQRAADEWIDQMAHARVRLMATQEKITFMTSVPFEEWGFYTTTFTWDTNFVSSLQEYRDASVTEELLARRLGEEHAHVARIREARTALHGKLQSIAGAIRSAASNDYAEAKNAYETLGAKQTNESKPLQINLELNKARRDVAIQQTVLEALRSHANQESESRGPSEVRIRLLEAAGLPASTGGP